MKMIPTYMSWYYSKNGTQLGPVPEEELLAKVSSGEVAARDLVWKEGMPDWKPLAQVEEFKSAGPVPVAPVQGPLAAVGNVPLQQPPAVLTGQVISPAVPNYMTLSIVATVLGFLLCWLIAMPLGIVAIVYSSKVEGLQRMGDLPGAVAASATAKTWMICSFACSALVVVVSVIFFAIVLLGGFANM